jgi:hypothetical protein
MTKKIFLLNGPPSSGKDSLANHIVRNNGAYTIDKMAYPLKQANKMLFSLTDAEYEEYEGNAVLKNTPQERFYGKSYRDIQIDLSEKFVKMNYDDEFFGRSLAARINNLSNPHAKILVPDSGFAGEARAVIREFGAENVYLIKLFREGFGYSGDSRSYISAAALGIKGFELRNSYLKDFLDDGTKLINGLAYDT